MKIKLSQSKKNKLKEFIFYRDKHCLECGSTENLTLDHIVPKALGGGDTIDNCQTLCKKCNEEKGAIEKDLRNLNDRTT